MVYPILRLIASKEDYMIPDSSNKKNYKTMFWWMLLHNVMIILGMSKTLYYLRIFNAFSKLVRLVWNVFPHVVPFTLFYAFFLFCFTLMYKVSGIDVVGEPEAYQDLHRDTMLVIQNFRNSIGDLSTPTYEFWFKDYKDGDPYTVQQTLMVLFAWVLWLTNIFFMLITLLNFLIAIISEAYE